MSMSQSFMHPEAPNLDSRELQHPKTVYLLVLFVCVLGEMVRGYDPNNPALGHWGLLDVRSSWRGDRRLVPEA